MSHLLFAGYLLLLYLLSEGCFLCEGLGFSGFFYCLILVKVCVGHFLLGVLFNFVFANEFIARFVLQLDGLR